MFKYQVSILFNFKIWIISFLFTCTYNSITKGQEVVPKISYGFKQDTVSIKSGNTFSNTFWIANHGSSNIMLLGSQFSGNGTKGLLRLPDIIKLDAGEKKWFPLKYIANANTIHKNLQELSIGFNTPENAISSATFYAQLEATQDLFIETDQQEIYLSQLSNQAKVMVRILNNGLIPVSFRLELTEIPDGLDFTGENTNFTIQPGQQLLLPFIAKNRLSSKQADFAVTIAAKDQSGAMIAQKQLRIMSVSSDRRLSLYQGPFYENRPNTIALRYNSIAKSLNSYQLQANGKYEFTPNSSLGYQLNADYFNNPGHKGLNLSNSYVEYKDKAWGLKLGSINESMDFNVSGRGIRANVSVGKNRIINAYILDNNYFLYSKFNKENKGNTLALSIKEENGYKNTKSIALIHNNSSFTGLKTTLVSSSANIPLSKGQYIGFEAGLSNERTQEMEHQDKMGGALGLNYGLSSKLLTFNSSNYYSSAYYGGFRKGLLQFDNSASLALGQSSSLSTRISVISNKPRFLSTANSSYIPVSNQYGSSSYELSYNRRMGKWNISLAPYYHHQYMQANNETNTDGQWKSSSMRTKLNVGFSYSSHEFALESDNGYTFVNTSQKPPAPFFSSRINFNYRNPIGGFTAFSQFNSFYLSDAVGISANPKYSMYTMGPNVRFALLNNAITINANAMYNYYGFNRSESYSLTGSLRWRLKDQWSVSTDFYYGINQRKAKKTYDPTVGMMQQDLNISREMPYRYNNKQFRIGIEKSFGHSGTEKDAKLEMCYFEDTNSNGLRDNNEVPVQGLLVKIEGIAAITRTDGLVKFTGTKNKTYQVFILNNNGWSLLHPLEVFLHKNTKLAVPLVKKKQLMGTLNYIKEKYKEEMPKLAGIRVKAVAANGLSFDAITDEKGEFNFYLPLNKYTVYVEAVGTLSIANPKEVVDLENSTLPKLVFMCKDCHRNIDIVKF